MVNRYRCLYMVCYLIQKGAKDLIGNPNKDGQAAINLITRDTAVQMEICKFLEDFASSLCSVCKNLPTSIYNVYSNESRQSVVGSIPLCSTCNNRLNPPNPESDGMDVFEPSSTFVNQEASEECPNTTHDNQGEAPMDQSGPKSLEDSSTSGVSSGRSSPRSTTSFSAHTVRYNIYDTAS